MTKHKLKSLAAQSLKAGPAITHDEHGNEYFAYVMYLREGMRYGIVVVDEDIVNLNGQSVDIMIAEAQAWLEYVSPKLVGLA